MARLKKKTIIFGSSGDIGKKIKQILNKDKILEINSRDLDLGNIEQVENFETNFIPDNIIFVSAKNNPKDFLRLNDKDIQEIFDINFISFIKILRKIIYLVSNGNIFTASISIFSMYY